MDKVQVHREICEGLNALYARKNHDYGDSFARSYDKWGLTMACMRLEDKLNRLEQFAKGGELLVNDESVTDTLLDIANYAIMTVIEMKKTEREAKQ